MMEMIYVIQILLYISSGLIVASFIIYFILVLIGRTMKVTNSDGFNITKDILAEYNSINIILNKGYFTVYNIKRKVIKIANNCYYGNTLSDISLPLIEAGISATDDKKNKWVNIFRKIFANLKYLYLLPLIAIIINSQTYNISDAKVSIIFISLFAIISYMIIDIKNNAILWISDKIVKIKDINKNNREKIVKFIKTIFTLDKLIFISELAMIIRCVMILLEM